MHVQGRKTWRARSDLASRSPQESSASGWCDLSEVCWFYTYVNRFARGVLVLYINQHQRFLFIHTLTDLTNKHALFFF